MEKRFFLAVFLSFGVLYAWNTFAPYKKPVLDYSQSTENNYVTIKPTDGLDNTSNKSFDKGVVLSKKIKEKEFLLESDTLSVVFSDRGGALTGVLIKKYDTALPITQINVIEGYEDKSFLANVKEGRIDFFYEDTNVKVEKSYILEKSGYLIESIITIENKDLMSNLKIPRVKGFDIDGSKFDVKSKDFNTQRDKGLKEYAVKYGKKEHRKSHAYSFQIKESRELDGVISWYAYRDRYFCAVIKPEYETLGAELDPNFDQKMFVKSESSFWGKKEVSSHMSVFVEPKGEYIGKGEAIELKSSMYVGPEEMSNLKKHKKGFEEVKNYYNFVVFDFFGKLVNQILHGMHKVLPNWGVCIVVLSFFIYFSMYPLTKRSMLSMRRMQAVAPKINAIKEKFKDNPKKLQKEMMEVYKKEKINPIGGCLPMFLQMPIFLGLYQVLWRSVSLKGAKFLWINDLTGPDKLFTFPMGLPLIGDSFNILPLLMVVAMFFQQRFSTKNMVTTDSAQKQQQKIMIIVMPLMMGVIFYNFSSGLNLYFTVFYSLSAYTQYNTSKSEKG